ncbi:hypothetical protein FKM82_012731 [Ascaphus truei]
MNLVCWACREVGHMEDVCPKIFKDKQLQKQATPCECKQDVEADNSECVPRTTDISGANKAKRKKTVTQVTGEVTEPLEPALSGHASERRRDEQQPIGPGAIVPGMTTRLEMTKATATTIGREPSESKKTRTDWKLCYEMSQKDVQNFITELGVSRQEASALKAELELSRHEISESDEKLHQAEKVEKQLIQEKLEMQEALQNTESAAIQVTQTAELQKMEALMQTQSKHQKEVKTLREVWHDQVEELQKQMAEREIQCAKREEVSVRQVVCLTLRYKSEMADIYKQLDHTANEGARLQLELDKTRKEHLQLQVKNRENETELNLALKQMTDMGEAAKVVQSGYQSYLLTKQAVRSYTCIFNAVAILRFAIKMKLEKEIPRLKETRSQKETRESKLNVLTDDKEEGERIDFDCAAVIPETDRHPPENILPDLEFKNPDPQFHLRCPEDYQTSGHTQDNTEDVLAKWVAVPENTNLLTDPDDMVNMDYVCTEATRSPKPKGLVMATKGKSKIEKKKQRRLTWRLNSSISHQSGPHCGAKENLVQGSHQKLKKQSSHLQVAAGYEIKSKDAIDWKSKKKKKKKNVWGN